MKTIEITDREQTILLCLIGIKEKQCFQENLRMDMKTEKFTEDEIAKYDCNTELIKELSALFEKIGGT